MQFVEYQHAGEIIGRLWACETWFAHRTSSGAITAEMNQLAEVEGIWRDVVANFNRLDAVGQAEAWALIGENRLLERLRNLIDGFTPMADAAAQQRLSRLKAAIDRAIANQSLPKKVALEIDPIAYMEAADRFRASLSAEQQIDE